MKNTSKNRLAALFLPLFLMACAARLSAQDYSDSTLLKVKFYDGNQLVGYVVKKTRDTVYFKNEAVGTISIPRSKVRGITRLDKNTGLFPLLDGGKKNIGQYWKDSPMDGTYFVGPSGYGLREGSGNYRNFGGPASQLNIGISDRFAFGIGGFLLPGLGPTTVSAKFNIPYKRVKGSAAFGYLFLGPGVFIRAFSTQEDPIRGLHLIYGVQTWGSRDHQLTVGTGYGFLGYRAPSQNFFNMISTMNRWNGKWAFISESYIFRNDVGYFAPTIVGLRRFGRVMILDFGIFLAIYNSNRPVQTPDRVYTDSWPMPWVSIAFPWNKKSKIPSNP